MKRQDFYYDLPEELIAQDPLEDRSSSRLLVLDKETGATSHHIFKEITGYLKEGDCLVINDTKVIPARLIGAKEGTGAKIEILLLKRKENNIWETLVKPGKKAKVGTRIVFGEGLLVGEVVGIVEEGNRLVKFEYEGIFEEILDQLGQMPLPPYITHQLEDKNRYQTVYAKHTGSAAAPTAGLHFTPELLKEIEEKQSSETDVLTGMTDKNGKLAFQNLPSGYYLIYQTDQNGGGAEYQLSPPAIVGIPFMEDGEEKSDVIIYPKTVPIEKPDNSTPKKTVNQKDSGNGVRTGDTANYDIYAAMFLSSAIILFIIGNRRRKYYEE